MITGEYKADERTEKEQQRLLGIYSYVDDVVAVIKELRRKKIRIDAVFSPTRSREMQEALGSGWSPVALFTLIGGICGGVGLIALAVYAHLSFHLITWGKPVIPAVPWVIVCFEGIILFSVLFSFVAWIFLGRLPVPLLPTGYDEIFSGDKFGIIVPFSNEDETEIRAILMGGKAEEVRQVSMSDPRKGVLATEATRALW